MATRGFVQRIAQLVTRELTEGLQQRDVEISPDHRGRDEHPLRRLAQALDAATDEAAHALRQLEVFFGVARLRMSALQHAFRLRLVAEGVLDEARVSLGGGLDA